MGRTFLSTLRDAGIGMMFVGLGYLFSGVPLYPASRIFDAIFLAVTGLLMLVSALVRMMIESLPKEEVVQMSLRTTGLGFLLMALHMYFFGDTSYAPGLMTGSDVIVMAMIVGNVLMVLSLLRR